MRWLRRNNRPRDGSFDEEAYLAANPDVRAGVDDGSVASGYAHYRAYGRKEGRPLDLAEKARKRILLDGIDVRSLTGVEIGALDKPLVMKSEGDITYVDYADKAFLQARYSTDPDVDCARIVDVDAVWGRDTLRQGLGEGACFDYVLASHVIEHVPDMITWLQEIHGILERSGSLRLAIPDKRYTFDYTRDVSSLSDLLDAHVRRARIPLPRMILDFCLNARQVDTSAAWRGPLDPAALPRHFTDEVAIARARDALENGTYHDVHCWVFTPGSFCRTMGLLGTMNLVDFACGSLVPTARNALEFHVRMVPCTDAAAAESSWSSAARKADAAG